MPAPLRLSSCLFVFVCTLTACGGSATLRDASDASLPFAIKDFGASSDFRFAIFSDLNGGERSDIFDVAVAQMDLMQPDFILSVGDLIDGGTEDTSRLTQEWDGFDARLSALDVPVIRIGGNHDLTNLTMRKVWEERYGQRYYHFVYRDVLFLVMDSEDFGDERMQEIYHARAKALKVLDETPDLWPETDYYSMPERRTGAIGDAQAESMIDALADHPDVRWTFVLMHKPVWRDDTSVTFSRIETALATRPYTVINGHFHQYSLSTRQDRDYIHLGTTGGSQSATSPMSFDHFMWVSMGPDGPTIANLRLDGVLDKEAQIPQNGSRLCFQASACGSQ